MKKVLSMILAIALMISIVPTGIFSINASAESTVVNIYNLAAFKEAVMSENVDIILWQDIVVTDSVAASCNSIDLNGNNLAINSNFKIENNDGSFKIFDSKYNKNTQTSSGSAAFSKGIDIGRSTLIVESGVITIHGENGYNGSDGTKSGSSGGNGVYGSDGIYGTGDLIFNNGFINISGGNGGQGGNGARGYHSSDQSYYYDKNGYAWSYDGGTGGTGGNGGNGASGINVTTISIFGGYVEVNGGIGGNGGRGGQGGNSSSISGMKTGAGGKGGSGGRSGYGANAITANSVNVYGGTLNCAGNNSGNPGAGGLGGFSGSGPNYDYPNSWGQQYQAASGSSGAKIYGGGAGICASLNVTGGSVNSQGAEYAAGIGGRGLDYGNGMAGCDIVISGGFVSATGGHSAYDIGGGTVFNGSTTKYGEAGEITVTGGTLKFNTKGMATNTINPSFKNCTVTGNGAEYYEGIYNSNGKFTIDGLIIKEEKSTADNQEVNKLIATFQVSRNSNIETPAPRGYVVFMENGEEVGTSVLQYSVHTSEGIIVTAEIERALSEETNNITAEYTQSSGDAYESGKPASYGVIEQIEITKNPDKTSYIEGTNFDDSGMELTAYYSNDFSEKITAGWTMLYDFSEHGNKEVKISYGGKEIALPVTVVEKTLTRIELTKNPNKMVYVEDTSFDDTGMELTLYYDNETSETITSGWTAEYDFSDIGMHSVIISFENKEISISVPVIAKSLDRIEITKQPNKMEYATGTKFIDTGMELTLYYDNGTSEIITTGWTTEYDFSKIGSSVVRIYYAGKEVTLNVSVVAIAIDRIVVTKNPNKLLYVEETQFVTDGMELTLYYNNDTSQKVYSGWTTQYDFSDVGQKEVEISYAGLKTSVFVTVVAKTITQIEVTNKPAKLQYLEGEKFSTSGMIVTVYYDNNTSETVTDYQVSGYTSTPGTKTITVTYQNKTATFNVTVLAKQLVSIAVTKSPIKTEYIEGTEFEAIGMEVTLYYNNNTSEVIISGWNVQYNFNQIGQRVVTITYGNKSTTFTVSVVAKTLSRIEITNHPSKLRYVEGEELNTSGMVVTAHYDNNTSEAVLDYQVSGYTSTPGSKTITVSYNGEFAIFEVIVIPIDYTIVFLNWDGSIISSTIYHKGDVVIVPNTPVRSADNTYTYTFAGWDKPVVNCDGNGTYTATYTPNYIDYTVIFKNYDGTVLSNKTYHYGDTVIAPNTPTKPEDDEYTYTFAGWDSSVAACNGNKIYTATFDSIKKYVVGDIDGVEGVTDRDAVHLLYYTFLPNLYPVNQDCDFNGDNEVNDKDAIYLLYYTFLPDLYPID